MDEEQQKTTSGSKPGGQQQKSEATVDTGSRKTWCAEKLDETIHFFSFFFRFQQSGFGELALSVVNITLRRFSADATNSKEENTRLRKVGRKFFPSVT